MSQEQIQARHLVELGFLEHIVNELGYPTQLLEKSPQLPFHSLVVGLEPDAQDRQMQLVLSFYPVSEEEAENSLLLQYFIELPFKVNEGGLARVSEFLPFLNNKTVVGHFGITAGRSSVHYRYVQALPLDRVITQEAVSDVITLASYTPIMFQEVIEALVEGKITVEQAQAQVDAKYATA